MTTLQWQRVLQIYESAWALPPDAATSLLDSLDEDPEVVKEVQALLQEDRRALSDSAAAPREVPEARYAGCSVGRYDVVALIGRGSNGDVYSGRDRELARRVALKFVSPEYAGTGSTKARFIREAQAAAALNHPNIITVHEVITWRSSPVIVMELVEGANLRALCRQPLPLARAIYIGSQFMQALAFAHANGIVHRDFKPKNVMVRPDGYVKLLDLGLARRTIPGAARQNLSSTAGLPVGTLRYMSPEQCRGEPATAASDVFAAGIVLSEMITGRHPFHSDSPLDTAHAIT